MLKFLISLDSSRQRFLYPAEMYFEEIHREQANEASTYRERAEKMNMERVGRHVELSERLECRICTNRLRNDFVGLAK